MADSVERVKSRVTTLRAAVAEAEPALTKLAEKLCATSADAKDLVQDTAERAMRLGMPADVRNPRAWLATMMHNLFIDRCRASARGPQHEPLDDSHDHTITPLEVASAEPAWSRVTLDDVRTALPAISETYREVYILHTFEHRSYEDIAALLKIKPITVGTRLTRARQELRKVLVARLGVEVKL
jgi:RNA polymerase sigma-70 factor (ECF subfamily)